jgi:hypothetical protein
MTEIVIVVRATADKCGKFDAFHEGRYLCTSTSPFIAAARILITHGYDPESIAIMRHDGVDADALTGRLGTVAGCDDVEPARPRRRKPVAPKHRQTVDRASLQWRGTELYRAGSNRIVASIVADGDNPYLWRVRQPDGSLSDQTNLTRARDAAETVALRPPQIDLKRGSVRSTASTDETPARLNQR